MRRWSFVLWSVLVFLSPWIKAQSSSIQGAGLTVEAQHDPIGISTPHPVFAWTLLSTQANARNLRQIAYRVVVATSSERLAHDGLLLWDSKRVDDATYWQRPYLGPSLKSHTTYYWRVQCWSGGGQPGPWSQTAHFTTGLLSVNDWTAHWIAAQPDQMESGPARENSGVILSVLPPPLPVFRHDLAVKKPIESAFLSVAGLGQYEVHLNGKQITDTVLNSGWTNYRKTISYDTYDVSKALRQGTNTLGILLGNGMYNVEGVKGHYTKFIGSFGQPKCILQLDVRYKDGTSTRVISDTSWQTHPGPILYSSIYGGETYDANALPSDWDRPGFSPKGWQPALEVVGPGGKLAPQMSAPMVVAETYKAVHVTNPKPGVAVYDMGVNASGWPSIVVQGPQGSTIHLLPGELLDADGTVSQRSTNAFPSDPVLYTYILCGGSPENWHPRFSYHSFRYVQVTTEPPTSGSSASPRIFSVSSEFVHARAPIVGNFTSSNALFNRIHLLIDRAVLSNLASVITDCPSREKFGWLEQTYLNASTLMLNYDVTGLYIKTASDMMDSQLPNGLVPSIAPEFVQFIDKKGNSTAFRDSPEWGSAVILSPWALYRYTGDSRPLAASYEAMKSYASYLKSRSTGGLLNYGLGDWYDIGPKPPGPSQLTSKLVTATGVYYEDLQALSQIATLLGHPADAADYLRDAASVREAFNRKLFHADTDLYDRGSQTAQAIPLALGLVPVDHVQAVLEHLVSDIRSRQDHVTGGDIGFHYIVRALTDTGRSDVLGAMLSRTDSPSYGYQLAQGATTLTEAWDANPESSQNHFMLGHGEEWFYRGLAGLSVDMAKSSGAALSFQPTLLPGITSVAASYRSSLGVARISWNRSGQTASIRITIPVGAQARLKLPKAESWHETEQSPATAIKTTYLTLGSGTYRFSTEQLRPQTFE